MELEVNIFKKADTYRAGKLSINGKFFCYTLEDKDRGLLQSMSIEEIAKIKVPKQTGIPLGKYEVTITISNRFKKPMIQLMNVKGYEGVRIHAGNTSADVEGCLAVAYEDSSDGFASNSKACADKLFKDIELAIKKEKIWITIK
jgi:hypothetical protein